MKLVLIGGALAMLAGGVYWQKDRLIVKPNVYAATPERIYGILDDMDIPKSPQGPMGTLDITKTGTAYKSIKWSGSGAHAMIDCTATLAPVAADRTQVDVACSGGGPSEGAAAGSVSSLVRIMMAEQVDSTLRGRPFNKEAVQMQASMNVLVGLPKMQAAALKMDAQAQRDRMAQLEAKMRDEAAQAGYGPVPGQGTDPTPVDPMPVQ